MKFIKFMTLALSVLLCLGAFAGCGAEVNYAEKIVTLKEAIAGMKNPDLTPEEKNRLLKAIVSRIELSTEDAGHNAVDIRLAVTLRL